MWGNFWTNGQGPVDVDFGGQAALGPTSAIGDPDASTCRPAISSQDARNGLQDQNFRIRMHSHGATHPLVARASMNSHHTSIEYEEWSPTVLQQWETLMTDPFRDAKKYTAFLRFVFKSYDIPATVYARKTRMGVSYRFQL